MRVLLLLFLTLSTSILIAQEWSVPELKIQQKYNLDKHDSRGLHFVDEPSSKLVFASLVEALVYFMNPSDIRTDITKVYIKKMPEDLELKNEIIGIHKVVKLYIEYIDTKQ